MTEGSEHTKRGEAKGFAGLSSLASDIDAILTPPKNPGPQNRTEPASSPARPVPTPVQSPQRSKPAQAYQAPPRSPSGSSGMKWLLGIGAVVGVIWYSNASSQKPSSSIPAYTPPTQETSTMKLIVVSTIVELFSDPAAHFKAVLRGHSHVPAVK